MMNRYSRGIPGFWKALGLALTLGAAGSASAQVIKGRLLDETNLGLPGASVVVASQGTGGTTDNSGNFAVTVRPADNMVVEIRYLGYTTQKRTVSVAKGQTVDLGAIKLAPEQNNLDEVVVVGYGVQRRREVTGSIVKLDAKKLDDMPTPSFESAIQGKAAGVQVITGSGVAGSGSLIRVRGVASVSSGGDPLYVVDGIPITQDYFITGNGGAFNNNPLASLNPNDIENIEILKDAASTSIYGSRGANGVILITTKRGKGDKLTWNFSTRLGTSDPTRRPEMLNSSEWLQLYKEAWTNDGKVGVPELPANLTWAEAQATNTDWVDQTITTGFKQRYDLSVQKATKKYNIYGGVSYDLNDSYLRGNSYERLSGRVNGDYKLSDKLSIGLGTSLARGRNNRVDNAWSGGLGAAMSTALPIYPIYNPDGTFWLDAGANNNPVAVRELKTWRIQELRSISNASLTYNPTKLLTLKATGAYDYMNLTEDVFEPGSFSNQATSGTATRTPRHVRNWNANVTAAYLHRLDSSNVFTYLIGSELQSYYRFREAFSTGNGTTSNSIQNATGTFYQDDVIRNDNPFDTIIPEERYTFASWFGRVNYAYQDKYLAQLVLRADGSSKFGPNKRIGFFPSLSVGWIMSEEDFLRPVEWLNYLKFKASIGYTGNAAFPGDQWRGTWGRGTVGYNGSPILYPINYENPNLQWENSRVIDFGVEFGLFRDRVTGEIAYYDRFSDQILLSISVPRSTGFSNYWDNVAEIVNRGFEFSIKTRNLVGDLGWTTEFNIASNYNELLSIGGYSADAVGGGTNDTRVIVGEPVGTNYLVRFSHVDPENGRPVYLDINGDPTYEWTPDDRVAVGDVLPDVVGGINNTFTYGGFDFSFLFAFVMGGDIYDSSSKRQLGSMSLGDGLWNHTPHIYDRWQQPGDQSKYPKLTTLNSELGSTTPWINTNLWLHDGSYLRLRNVQLGYNFPTEQVNRWRLDRMRVYVVATNLLTFTKYPGLDPEIARDFENATDRNMSPNITYLTAPQERTFSLGIDLSF